jgi:hypothetical protein
MNAEAKERTLISTAEEMKFLLLSREKAKVEYDKDPIDCKRERIEMLNAYIYKLEDRMNSLAF